MYSEIFTGLFQSFIDKNPFLLVNSYNTNYINISLQGEKTLYKKMLEKDNQYFNILMKELKNQKICNNISDIYCLIFNECININSDISQQKVICSLLKNYLSNIINEINDHFLGTLEDKYSFESGNQTKSQKGKSNKKNLRITIKLLFLVLVFMLNKYKSIIDNTFKGCVIKGINVKNLTTNKIREELFLLIILQQNLYWMNIIIDGLLAIFQNLKNNKFKMLVNGDNEFNKLDGNFKDYCFECFLNLFNIVKKYSSIKLNDGATRIHDVLFKENVIENDTLNNCDNIFLPLNIGQIDNNIFKLFECFIYEFLYDIEALLKYFDDLKQKENNNDYYGILCGFSIYLCEFIKLITFVRNEDISKVDFFNFYFFSYKLLTNYFSNQNIYLYDIYTKLCEVIKGYPIYIKPDLNLNYLQNLSNSLKDMLFNFMISSYNNDTLKDIYSFNEILINSIVSHCLIKTILSIYSLLAKGENKYLLTDFLSILLDNINKYKLILPLKSHFYKELMTHNYLLILDEFLNKNENNLISYFQEKLESKKSKLNINNLFNKFNETLSCLFNHYNPVNFIYSNHIMFKIRQILSNSGMTFPYSNFNSQNIFLRYIYSDNNHLNYKDIPIADLTLIEKFNPEFRFDSEQNIKYENLNEISFDNITYNKELNNNEDNIGFPLDDYLDENTIKLLSNIKINEYKFQNCGYKSCLVKNSIEKNYSIILVQSEEIVEKIGIDEKMNKNILNIMENNQYTDKIVYKLIQQKVINPENTNISINNYFYENIKYYDLKFEMSYFEYQNKIKELLL